MKQRTINQRHLKKNLFIFCVFLIPTCHFLLFWLYTNISAILMAFQDKMGNWVGLEHFKWYISDFFAEQPKLKATEALINTFKFWLFGILVETPVALTISYFFYKKIKGHQVFNVILYLPCIISSIIMTTVFKNTISSSGPLAEIWEKMGWGRFPLLLYNSKYAFNTLIFYNIWTGFGTSLIIYTAAMKKIPPEVTESAMLDGAGMWTEFRYIVWPLIWQTFSTFLIIGIGNIFTASGPVLLLTGGDYGTQTISFTIFQQFKLFNQGNRASAIGLLYSSIALPIVFTVRRLVNKVDSGAEY